MTRLFAASLLAVSVFGQTGARWHHPKTQPLPSNRMGPFTSLPGDRILTVDGQAAWISGDGGATWEPHPMFPAGPNLKISNERAMVRTRSGAVIVVFMDMHSFRWRWDNERRRQGDDIRADVWSARSVDDGRTWTDVQLVQRGYCGAIRDMIQTRSGKVVVTAQNMIPAYPRHFTQTYASGDEGRTWQASNLLDLGGSGHHEGSIEATVEQLKDGRLWLLLRTSLDKFWEAFSEDDGLRWTVLRPSAIEASTAPGLVKRLRSGRLVLLWNRPQPEGETLPRRDGGQAYAQPVWAHRGELSMAFSNDEGKTWTKPVVIARERGKSLAYPYLYEQQPGVLWVTTMQGGVRRMLREADFAD